MNLLVRKFLIIGCVVVIASCGYHLRKAIELPDELKSLYVQGASGPLFGEIRRVWKTSSGKLVGLPDDAGMIVNVYDENIKKNVLSLSSTGKATEFELYYSLSFELTDKNGKVVVPRQLIEISRDYFDDQSSDNVLGRASEEGVIRQEMYKQAVRSIVASARSVLKPVYTQEQ